MLLVSLRNVAFARSLHIKLFALFLAGFLNTAFAHSHTTPIPDSTFEQALISLNIDTNGLNGNILNSDAINVQTLFIGNIGVTDLTGIEAFKNLVNLYAYNNSISTADFSENPHLEIIDLDNNSIHAIDISMNSDLKYLYLSNNALTGIDVSTNLSLELLSVNLNSLSVLDVSLNTSLKDLRCYSNNLTNISIINNPNLEYLVISENNLNSINVSMNANLETFTCDNNNLNTIDITSNPSLEYFSCSNNNLSSLDISSNPSLKRLLCNNNNLTAIDVSNMSDLFLFYTQNNQIQTIDVSSNPNLRYFRAENNMLDTVDARNGQNDNVNEFVVTQNTNLTCIYVDDITASYLSGWQIDSSSNFVADEDACQTLSLSDAIITDFKMYPNPATTHLNVSMHVPEANLSVYTIRGQYIFDKQIQEGKNAIDISSLSSGLYVVTITTNNSTITKKLIVE